VIIGVTCAVVVAMVIAGIIVGVKFFLDSTNDIVKVTVVISVIVHWLQLIMMVSLDDGVMISAWLGVEPATC